MLNQDFGDKGLSGWKQAAIFGEPPGYSGSTNFGVVVINSYFRGVPQFYNHVPTSGGIQTMVYRMSPDVNTEAAASRQIRCIKSRRALVTNQTCGRNLHFESAFLEIRQGLQRA